MARPTKYEPRYCEMIIEHMAEGYSAVSFAGKVGVVRSTINKWADDFPEFKEALDVAKSRALMFWEDRLINVAKGGGGPGSGPVAIFGVTNLGDGHWRNKQEHDHMSSDGSMKPTVIQFVSPEVGNESDD